MRGRCLRVGAPIRGPWSRPINGVRSDAAARTDRVRQPFEPVNQRTDRVTQGLAYGV